MNPDHGPQPTMIAGRYRIVGVAGKGPLSMVYEAEDIRGDRKVAVKIPHVAPVIDRFLREIRLAERLTHPHILPLLEAGEHEGTVYSVWPFLPEASLRDRLNRDRMIPLGKALEIATQISDALGYLHDNGLVHLGVKPENILLEDGQALLSDFGLIRLLSAPLDESKVTRSGFALGTSEYMSPEQVMGTDVDARTDVYALGCVLYEMLSGDPPFPGTTPHAIMTRQLQDTPTPLAASSSGAHSRVTDKEGAGVVPQPVWKAIERSLQKQPEARFAGGHQLLGALLGLMNLVDRPQAPTQIDRPPCEHIRDALAHRYRVTKKIGQGGMAVVCLADDLWYERQVAIKVLMPERAAPLDVTRFLKEMRTTAKLNHPHILQLLEAGDAKGLPYFVMPYVKGGSLRTLLNERTTIPAKEAVSITVVVADALQFAHDEGLVHRDIKPDNILLHHGHPVVADFGIARGLDLALEDRITRDGYGVGTPPYASPEQMSGQTIDVRTDVYSLGCVLFEMLTGVTPTFGATPSGIDTELAPVDFSDCPGAKAPLITALAFHADERHSSVAEFRNALAAVA